MAVESQSSSSSFFQAILLPKLRIGFVLLAVLAIGFGSWLETNESVSSCSFKSSLAMHQVFFYRNISSNLITPDSATFGLWRHCYMYALNCSCSPVNIKYQPDFSTILQEATENNATASSSDSTSLSRIIPLILATITSVVALLLTSIANKLRQYTFRRIVSGLILATIVLVAYAFGSTYSSYSKTARQVCRDPDTTVLCSNYGIQAEVIIFSIALGLLFLGFLFWIVTTFSRNEENTEEITNEKRQSAEWAQTAPIQKKQYKKRSTPSPPENDQYYSSAQDELAVWRDVTFFDKNLDWEQEYQSNENENMRQHQHYQRQKHYQPKSHSQYNMNEHNSLSPPPPTKRNYQAQNHRSRVTESNNNKRTYTSTAKEYYNQRKTNRDSTLTPGTPQKSKRSSQQGSPYYDYERQYRNKTPTNMSPHPFTSNDGRRGSYNMGYNYDNDSSASNSSSGYYQSGQRSYTDIPMLHTIPGNSAVEHPLTKKKIKDRRIQNYLQSS